MSRAIHHSRDLAVLLGLLLVLVFASPLAGWWAGIGLPWYAPYLMWTAIIILGAILARRRRPHEP